MVADNEDIPTSPAVRKRSYPFIQFTNPDLSPVKQSLPSPPLQSKDYLVFKKGLDTFGGSSAVRGGADEHNRGSISGSPGVGKTETENKGEVNKTGSTGSIKPVVWSTEGGGGGVKDKLKVIYLGNQKIKTKDGKNKKKNVTEEDGEETEKNKKEIQKTMGNSGYIRCNGKGESEEPRDGRRSTPPYPAGEYNDSLPPVLESNPPIERSSRVGQHLLPVGVLRENAGTLLTRRTTGQPYPRKSALAISIKPAPSSLNPKGVTKPNQKKLDFPNSAAENEKQSYIIPKEIKCESIQKSDSLSGHSTLSPAAILDPALSCQSQGHHVTNKNQSGELEATTPSVHHFNSSTQSDGETDISRPIGAEQTNSLYVHWSKLQSNQPIKKKMKQLSRSRKLNTRYPAPEKPRQKRAVIQDMVRPLKQWLLRHRHNPYPSKTEKVQLALNSQMNLTQVANWFANARRRLKNVVHEPRCSWSKRLRLYNKYVQGNAELLSISSEDSIWNSEDEDEDEERPDSVGYDGSDLRQDNGDRKDRYSREDRYSADDQYSKEDRYSVEDRYSRDDRYSREDPGEYKEEGNVSSVVFKHREREHSYSIPGCRSSSDSSQLSTPDQVTPYVSPPSSPPTLTPQRPLTPCSPEPSCPDTPKYKTTMLYRYLQDAADAQSNLHQGTRSDIKEEDADEYEDEDEDDVSRTPASSPNLSKTGCDSPGTDLHCDNLNSRNTQHQSINQLDSKPPQAEQRTSLYDFIKDESGYTTPEQVETEEKVCIRPEQRRVRLQSEDLSDNDPGYKDRELIKKHLVFDSEKYGRRHVPYRVSSGRSPPRPVSPFLSPIEEPVPPVGAQEEVVEDSRRDAFTPAEQFIHPTHTSSPSIPPAQEMSNGFYCLPSIGSQTFQLSLPNLPQQLSFPPRSIQSYTFPSSAPSFIPSSSNTSSSAPALLIGIQSTPHSYPPRAPDNSSTSHRMALLPGLPTPPQSAPLSLISPNLLSSAPGGGVPPFFQWPRLPFPFFPLHPDTNCDINWLPPSPANIWQDNLRRSELDAAMTLSQLAGGYLNHS